MKVVVVALYVCTTLGLGIWDTVDCSNLHTSSSKLKTLPNLLVVHFPLFFSPVFPS